MKSKDEIPQGWIRIELNEIALINPRIKPNEYPDDLEVSFLPMKAVEEETGDYCKDETRFFGEVKKGYTSFRNGDLIFAKITPCMENGKIALLDNLKNGIGYGSTEFHVLRIRKSLDKRYFFFYLVQKSFRENARRKMTGSAGQLRVPKSFLSEFKVPLPPLPEQHRIVAKIESLFTQLDKGVEQLTAIQQQLKTYRQAVLKAAFEGNLTAAWREQHQPPPASELLEQIKVERERQYEQDVADWKIAVQQWEANGKEGKKPGKPRKLKEYPELTRAEKENLAELPEGWIWVKVSSIIINKIANGKSAVDKSDGVPILRLTALKEGLIDIDEYKLGDIKKKGR